MASMESSEIKEVEMVEAKTLQNDKDFESDMGELSENLFLNENDNKDATKLEDAEENSYSKSYDIIKFLTDISLAELIDLFVSEAVNMEMLYQMSGDHLKELGVSKYGHRFHILNSIKRMFT